MSKAAIIHEYLIDGSSCLLDPRSKKLANCISLPDYID